MSVVEMKTKVVVGVLCPKLYGTPYSLCRQSFVSKAQIHIMSVAYYEKNDQGSTDPKVE